MLNMSMCRNEDCKVKGLCIRYMAIPDTYQPYALFPVLNGKCQFYVATQNDDKLREFIKGTKRKKKKTKKLAFPLVFPMP